MRVAVLCVASALGLSACGDSGESPTMGSREGSCEDGATTAEQPVTSIRYEKAIARVEYDSSGSKSPCFVEAGVEEGAIRLVPHAEDPEYQTLDLNAWCVEVKIPTSMQGLPLLDEPYPKVAVHSGKKEARQFLRTTRKCVQVEARNSG